MVKCIQHMGYDANTGKKKKFLTPSKVIAIIVILVALLFTPMGKKIIFQYKAVSSWTYEDGDNIYIFSGTGFFVNPNKVLTSYSSVRGCISGVSVLTRQGVFNTKILTLDEAQNFAVLATSADRKIYAVVGNNLHFEGGKYAIADFEKEPGEFGLKESLTLINDPKKQNDIIFPKGWLKSGNEGAPVFDSKGYVVGMITRSEAIDDHPIIDSEPVTRAANLNALIVFLNKQRVAFYRPKSNEPDYFLSKAYKDNLAVGILCGNKKNGSWLL